MAEDQNLILEGALEGSTSEDVARVEAEAHDEIDDIMAEIERIKTNMGPAAAEVKPVTAAPVANADPVVAHVDFGQANTDAPLEDTLGGMAVEEAAGGLLEEEPPVAVSAESEEPTVGSYESEGSDSAASDVSPPMASAPESSGKAPFVPRLVSEAGPAEGGGMRAPQRVAAPPSMGDMPAGAGALSMTLTGSMKLALKYEMDGQEVTIGFDSQFLHLSLADGSEFKIPVARERRKAA